MISKLNQAVDTQPSSRPTLLQSSGHSAPPTLSSTRCYDTWPGHPVHPVQFSTPSQLSNSPTAFCKPDPDPRLAACIALVVVVGRCQLLSPNIFPVIKKVCLHLCISPAPAPAPGSPAVAGRCQQAEGGGVGVI